VEEVDHCQPLIIYSAFVKYFRNNETALQLIIDFKKAYDSVRREALYNILSESGIPTKMIRLIKMCLNETYSRVRVGKHLSGMFPLIIFRNKEVLYSHCFSNLL